MDKRQFLRTVSGTMSAAVFGGRLLPAANPPPRANRTAASTSPRDFWTELRARYTLPTERIDLEHGYYSRMSDDVRDALVRHVHEVNRDASFYMRTRWQADRAKARAALAAMAGCSPDELIVTRNTTESLDTVIAGFPWQQGDEAVMAEQDYHAMLSMFRQVARRHGITNKVVSVPMHPQDDDEIVAVYRDAITERTRLLMVCHVINITGQVLPVKKIVDMAHARGVQVMVDGAHAFGQLDFRIEDLGCDYYGSSLHKWLGCPLGSGLLYVRPDRVGDTWPLFGDHHGDDDIDKLNHTGTHPAHTDLAILDAIAFHDEIGAVRKLERLRFLQRYWTGCVREVDGVMVNTPDDPERTCAIANVGVTGVRPQVLAKRLLEQHRIATVPIDGAGVHGVRVTPHLYTTTDELDQLVAALQKIAAEQRER